MRDLIPLLGTINGAIAAFGTALFALTSLREGERRAAALALAFGLPAAALPLGLAWLRPAGWDLALGALLGGEALLALLVLLPVGRARALPRAGSRVRVDERDALFHRFYRLEPGTPEHEAWYAEHPEQRTLDDRLRALPGLGSPGSASYHPETAPFAAATFEVISRLNRGLDVPPAPLQAAPLPLDPATLTARLKGFARHHGAVAVGCASVDPADVYTHIGRGEGEWGSPIALSHPRAIVVAVEMHHALVAQAPRAETLTESAAQYLEGAKIAQLLAHVLRAHGYEARAHVDGNYRVMVVPLAVAAGLGELGRLGLLLTPRYGPRVRLAAVTTDAPLLPDGPIAFGAAAFCAICRKCAEACPSGAIPSGLPAESGGLLRWVSHQERCYRHWRAVGTDCAICLKVCPFSHPDTPVHHVVRALVPRSAVARRLAIWGDDLCYGRAPAFRVPAPRWHRE